MTDEEQKKDFAEMDTWYQFDDYQDFTDRTAIYPEDRGMEYLLYGLTSEVGEIAAKMKREIRDDELFENEDLAIELGDVLWYLAQIASYRGFYLSGVAQRNVEKLTDRMNRGTLGGEGDYR